VTAELTPDTLSGAPPQLTLNSLALTHHVRYWPAQPSPITRGTPSASPLEPELAPAPITPPITRQVLADFERFVIELYRPHAMRSLTSYMVEQTVV
jgi:hypothetical protein